MSDSSNQGTDSPTGSGSAAPSPARNTPSEQRGGDSSGSRMGSQTGTGAEHTGLADGVPASSTQGLTGAQGSGGGAERGIEQPPQKRSG